MSCGWGLKGLDKWLCNLWVWSASRAKIDRENWFLVVEPILVRGMEIYMYYYIVPENCIITWIERVNGYLLFQECTTAWHWNHKRLELEAQYWQVFNIAEPDPNKLSKPTEALAIEQSTAASIFWTLDQMKEMAAELATAEELAGHTGTMGEHGIAIYGHHEYLNHHGQPEACLIHKDSKNFPFMAGAGITMLWIPVVVLKRLKNIYVDGVVNGIDIKAFTDNL
ncbi:hypothetical protein EDD22DRAFT_851025 [Suillus occidentalis]|nr:hypothetical protein EDD22DRAFT_851025 [Suillus occidentalis]